MTRLETIVAADRSLFAIVTWMLFKVSATGRRGPHIPHRGLRHAPNQNATGVFRTALDRTGLLTEAPPAMLAAMPHAGDRLESEFAALGNPLPILRRQKPLKRCGVPRARPEGRIDE
jgi:hypothetical protein